MKNKEKYLDEIINALACNLAVTKTGDVKHCGSMICVDCKFYDPSESCVGKAKKWLEEEYQELIKLTDDEKAILRNVDKQYEWIARQKSGSLILYKDKPIKAETLGNWLNKEEFNFFQHFNHLFQFIKWKDDEPYNIDDLLKTNGVER